MAEIFSRANPAAHDESLLPEQKFRRNAVKDRVGEQIARGQDLLEELSVETFTLATGLKLIAVVGQETMHSPHWTQPDSPIGSFRSKPMPAVAPLPVRPMISLCFHFAARADAAVAEDAGAVVDLENG